MNDAAYRIARILRDMECLRLEPAYVARQARRLRPLIEELSGREIPHLERLDNG